MAKKLPPCSRDSHMAHPSPEWETAWHLKTSFQAITLNRTTRAIPAWGLLLDADLQLQINFS